MYEFEKGPWLSKPQPSTEKYQADKIPKKKKKTVALVIIPIMLFVASLVFKKNKSEVKGTSISGLRSRWSRWAPIEEDAGTVTISSRGWGTVVSWVIDADLFRALRALKTGNTATKRTVERDADSGAVCSYITSWLSWVVDAGGAIRAGGKAAAAAYSSCGPGSYSGCRAWFDADARAVSCDIAAWLAGVIDTDGAVRARRKAAAATYSCSGCRCHTGCAAGWLRAFL